MAEMYCGDGTGAVSCLGGSVFHPLGFLVKDRLVQEIMEGNDNQGEGSDSRGCDSIAVKKILIVEVSTTLCAPWRSSCRW